MTTQQATAKDPEAVERDQERERRIEQEERPLTTEDLAEATTSRAAADERSQDSTADAKSSQQARQEAIEQEREPLFAMDRSTGLRGRWDTIQTAFVDDPRASVQQADTLVAEVIQELASSFAHERKRLDSQWSRGDDVSTEDLRVALRRYRSFFDRLLSV